jgi:hypothetical protein
MFLKPMKISRPLEMHKRCERCGQPFEPEAGFYYGAMFISYIFIAFISLSGVGLLVFVFNVSVNLSFGILLTFLAIIFFWNLRFARSLWIHLMVKYNPQAADDYIKNVSDPKTD